MPGIDGPRIGLIVNPIAGIGGRLAARGSDLFESLEAARTLGGTPVAQDRAMQALRRLRQVAGDVALLTASGAMGSDVASRCGFEPVIVVQRGEDTTATDTKEAAQALMEFDIDLLIFAGGDGTARDIFSVVGDRVAMIGIPTGVKMQSAVFALHPEAAGEAAARALRHPRGTRLAEIMDADETELAAGRPSARLFGYAATPAVPALLQAAKGARPNGGEAAIEALGRMLARDMPPDRLVILGPGTTMQIIKHGFGFEGTLLGVDAVAGGRVVARDADAARLEMLSAEFAELSLLVGVIGNQGFVFGRGNQQISPAVIRKAGRENVRIIATREKLLALQLQDANVNGAAPPAMPLAGAPAQASLFSPTGRRWPEGSDEGASHPRSPLICPTGIFSPRGEEGTHRHSLGRAEGGIRNSYVDKGTTPTLHTDTGDPTLDASLAGYHRILTGPNDVMMMRIASAT